MEAKKPEVRQYSMAEVRDQLSRGIHIPIVEKGSYTMWYGDGPFIYESDFPCPICRQRIAILNTSRGIFEPCFECGSKGYVLVNLETQRKWWQFWKYFGIYNRLFENIQTNKRNASFFYSIQQT